MEVKKHGNKVEIATRKKANLVQEEYLKYKSVPHAWWYNETEAGYASNIRLVFFMLYSLPCFCAPFSSPSINAMLFILKKLFP